MKTLDTINSLYLELSHVATATTAKELATQEKINDLRKRSLALCYQIEKLPAGIDQTTASLMASELFGHLQSFNVADTQ